MEQYMIWVWLAVFVIAFVVEASTNELVSIWFGIGALVALCVSGFTPYWAELIVFSVVSLVALILTRPLIMKLTERSVRYTNIDEVVGRLAILEKTTTKFEPGEVRINGIVYTAILPDSDDSDIVKGSVVELLAFKGNKAVVKKIKAQEEN